jgi:hypothetical protein
MSSETENLQTVRRYLDAIEQGGSSPGKRGRNPSVYIEAFCAGPVSRSAIFFAS